MACCTDSAAGSPRLGASGPQPIPTCALWSPWLRGPSWPQLSEWSMSQLHAPGHRVNVAIAYLFRFGFVFFFFKEQKQLF